MVDGKVPVLECLNCRGALVRSSVGKHYLHKDTRAEECPPLTATPNYEKFDRERAESRQKAIEDQLKFKLRKL